MLVTSCLAVAGAAVAAAPQSLPASSSPVERCTALVQGRDPAVTARFASIADAPSLVETADILPARDGLPEICRVYGHIAPDVAFELRLPTQTWNHKLMMQGCGGPCGDLSTAQGDPALARNYAVVSTDMGHTVKGWIFAYENVQGELDFAFRSTHVTAAVAKEIIDQYYSARPAYSYFNGCSTGGRQGMVEAQRFPHDFNGVIAGAPVYNETGDVPLALFWAARVNLGRDGKPILDAAQLGLIHDSVLASCDALDGLKDGVIQDPRRCRWSPSAIQCGAKGVSSPCLSAEQVAVVDKIYSGATNSKGEPLYFGMAKGSEWDWSPSFIGADGHFGSDFGGPGQPFTSVMSYLTFFYKPGPGYDPAAFNYDRDPDRLALNEALYSASNPDLRKFKAAGGKLILWHGWDDNQIPSGASLDYYETATRTMGGPAPTEAFFRLFMLPTTAHCGYGAGGSEVDWITALENWVEKAQAPDAVTVYHLTRTSLLPRARHPLQASDYDKARPVFPYPQTARYKGKGDPNLAQNWEAAPSTRP